MGGCVSTRGLDTYPHKNTYGNNLPPKPGKRVHPERRNRLQYLTEYDSNVTIDNLPWSGEDAIL